MDKYQKEKYIKETYPALKQKARLTYQQINGTGWMGKFYVEAPEQEMAFREFDMTMDEWARYPNFEYEECGDFELW